MTTNRKAFTVPRVLALTGPVMFVIWMVGFIFFAGFIPVPDPEDSPAEIRDHFAADREAVLVGLRSA